MVGLLSLASMIPQIVGGVVANRSHKKQSDLLGGMTLDMPSGISDAESILRKQAAQGMPGYDKYKGDIEGSMATGLSAYKDVIDNPAAILGALSSSQTGVNDALSELAIKDSLTKLQNEKSLAGFLGSTKAGAEMQIDQYGDQMKVAAGEEKQRGLAELMSGISGGLSTGMTTFGGLKSMEAQNELLGNMSNYWKKSGTDKLPEGITPEMLTQIMNLGKQAR